MVNKRSFDHESVRIEVSGIGQVLTMPEVNYDVEKGVKLVYNADGTPRGYVADGELKATWDITISRQEYRALAESLSDTGVLNAEPLTVTVTYANDDEEAQTDKLVVKITKVGSGSKRGDEAMQKLEGVVVDVPEFAGQPVWKARGERR